jgi:hypothetical protein
MGMGTGPAWNRKMRYPCWVIFPCYLGSPCLSLVWNSSSSTSRVLGLYGYVSTPGSLIYLEICFLLYFFMFAFWVNVTHTYACMLYIKAFMCLVITNVICCIRFSLLKNVHIHWTFVLILFQVTIAPIQKSQKFVQDFSWKIRVLSGPSEFLPF